MLSIRTLFKAIFKKKTKEESKKPVGIHSNEVNIPIQEGVTIYVYNNIVENVGSGVTLDLEVNGFKILKFDMFGPNGHFHIFSGSRKSGRIHFLSTDVEQQMERVLFELEKNSNNYRRLAENEQIQNLRINRVALGEALPRIKKELLTRM